MRGADESWLAGLRAVAIAADRHRRVVPIPVSERLPDPVEAGEGSELVAWLRQHAIDCEILNRPIWAGYANRAADLLEQQEGTIAALQQQPAPAQGELTDEELIRMAHRCDVTYFADDRDYDNYDEVIAAMRAAIAADRQRRVVPIPVSKRLPGPEDCDAEGRCWWFNPRPNPPCGIVPGWRCGGMLPGWRCGPAEDLWPWYTHWLPAYDIPYPQSPQGEEVE